MQLFKSEWLYEPRPAFGRGVRGPGFAPRYGVRVERAAPVHPSPVCMPDAGERMTPEHEREPLWEIARFDRAA